MIAAACESPKANKGREHSHLSVGRASKGTHADDEPNMGTEGGLHNRTIFPALYGRPQIPKPT
jgi:hypothetical protein